ncbi:MAG: glycosyltransferase family 39 protein [Anaerolineae bacterium]|nr:glycosyltransferase family 39 protein [Thermoflexales bacterium]MDW8408265.1 glycosyltransferase family 39 protein [Anaerolineae bacterium]
MKQQLRLPSFDQPAQRVLLLIVGLFVAAGGLYGLASPFMEVSDEVRHYAFVEHLAQGNGLPIQDPARRGFYEQEGSQPPLYYALMALIVQPFDRSDFYALAQFNPHGRLGRADTTHNWNQLIHTDAEQFPWRGTVLVMHVIRLLGVLMGAVTVVCAWLLATELVGPNHPQRARIALLSASFVAFNPMFVFISASVNNDTLATMLSSIALWLGARGVMRGVTPAHALILGIVLGGAALTKSSALALVLAIPPAVLASMWLRGRNERRPFSLTAALLTLLRIGLPIALIAGWWYVRNQLLYNDFTGTTMMAQIAGPREQLPTLVELLGEWDGFRKAYWGLFGAVNIPMHNWIYLALDAVWIMAALGLALTGLHRWRAWRAGGLSAIHSRDIATLMCLAAFGIALAALARWTSITLASQGRLLFPLITVISALTATGLVRFWVMASVPRIARLLTHRLQPLQHGLAVAVWVLPIGLALLTMLAPFVYIRPAYALPTRLSNESLLPADLNRVEMRFGPAIRWIGYRVERARLQPGDYFEVSLYWQGLEPMRTNESAFIRLFGRDGAQVALLDTYPGGGMWQTTRWQAGEIIVDRYRLHVSETLSTPTVLRMDVGFWNFDSKAFLPAYDGAGQPIGRPRHEVASITSNTQHSALTTQQPAAPHLSHAMPISLTTHREGNRLRVIMHWLATQDFIEAFTIFMHLVDETGALVAQADGPADNGNFPIRWWRQGDVVTDERTIELPNEIRPGRYRLEYGFYRPGDGTRLPAFDAQGQPIPDAALRTEVAIEN